MTRTFKNWLVSLLVTAAVVPVCILWLDRPVAQWVHTILGEQHILFEPARSPVLSIPFVASLLFVICGLVGLNRGRFSKLESTVAVSVISTLNTIVVKDQLKFVFGRTWPVTWAPGIQSFLGNNAYGFHYFKSGVSFESFPSGHAAISAAIVSILWILSPNLRVLCALCVITVDIGLVALNLHFLSDVIAGSFVGLSTGLFTIALWRAISPDVIANIPWRSRWR